MGKHIENLLIIIMYFFSLGSDSNDNVQLMTYFYFVISVNQYIFFAITCILTKSRHHDLEPYSIDIIEDKMIQRQNAFSSLGNLLFPSFCWFVTKYNIDFSINILVMAILTIPNQVTYVLNLLGSGNNVKSML